MALYEIYKINLTKLKPLVSELQSDTIFGHVAWAIKFLYGDDELKKFIAQSLTENPPFICSDGFPNDYLPFPNFDISDKEVHEKRTKEIFNKFNITEDNKLAIFKLFKNIPYIHKSIVKTIANLNFTDIFVGIFEGSICKKLMAYVTEFPEIYSDYKCSGFEKCILFKSFRKNNDSFDNNFCVAEKICKNNIPKTIELWRCSIDRKNFKAAHGLLHSENIKFFNSNGLINIYAKINVNIFNEEKLNKVFEFIALNGFGADASIGSGGFEFKVEKLNNEERKYFIPSNDSNGCIILSNFIPNNNDPKNCSYKVFTKYPKLYNVGLNIKDPFKIPLMMIKPGAILRFNSDNEKKEFYGKVITNIAPHVSNKLNVNIIQSGLALPYYIKLK